MWVSSQVLNIVDNNNKLVSTWNMPGMPLQTLHTPLHNLKSRNCCHCYFTHAEVGTQRVCSLISYPPDKEDPNASFLNPNLVMFSVRYTTSQELAGAIHWERLYTLIILQIQFTFGAEWRPPLSSLFVAAFCPLLPQLLPAPRELRLLLLFLPFSEP